jgi:DNA adenine methylase
MESQLFHAAERKRVRPPFAWYGGKQRVAGWLIERFPEHVRYVEPFGGAGNVLLAKPPSEYEVFNDLDHRVVNFYRVLRDRESFDLLQRHLELSPYAREEFRDAIDMGICEDANENARRFFVIMKQARGGLGMSPTTKRAWAVSTRTRRKMPEGVSKYLSAIDGLPEIHERLRSVIIECLPAIEVIQKYDGEDTFFYLDPTYLPETRHGQTAKTYAHEMTEEDHVALLDVILKVEGKVMISGYPSALYDEKLRGWRREELVTTAHVANSGQQRVEVIWMNY